MLLAAFFLWGTICAGIYAGDPLPEREDHEAREATQALTEEQIVVYNNAYTPEDPRTPVVYVVGLSLMGEGLTVRVYDSADTQKRNLLGWRQVEDTSHGFTVEIPIAELSPAGGSVYVTIQRSGLEESAAVRADYTRTLTSYAQLDVIKINEQYTYEQKEFANSWPLYDPAGLTAGKYYLVDVKLTNFHTVGGVTVPIHYNKEYLELVPVLPSTKKINTDASKTVSADEGAWFNFAGRSGIYRASLECGVLPGFNSDYGTAGGIDDYPVAKGSDPGEYPYLNTDTGLVKLEVMKDQYGAFDYRDGKWQSGVSVVRLVFRAKKSGAGLTDMDGLVHFATVKDYVAAGGTLNADGRPADSQLAARTYATQHPAGLSVTLEDAQLLMTPPAVTLAEVDFSEEDPLRLTAEDVNILPEGFESKASMPALPENSIKIYNYTNSGSYVSGLDAYLSDRLVLSPSAETGGVVYEDVISVYGDSALTQLLGQGTADSEGAVDIDLYNKLAPEGGKVYITNRRAGVTSAAEAFDYPPEVHRNITFRVYRSALPQGVPEGTDPIQNPEALKHVKKGEQFQIRVFVNDINDLMGYTFPIHFNTLAVKASDQYFRPVEKDGYMSETDFFRGNTPFSVGEDISELTAAELIIYYAQEAEIPDLMEQLGISDRAEWDRRKQDIKVKLDFGVSGGSGAWNGGLLFTGPRDGQAAESGIDQSSTVYPYVDNNVSSSNGQDHGLIKVWATSLTSPVERLAREGGYHFLTMNFTGVTNVDAESAGFRFAVKSDAVFDEANPDGGRLVISGPEESAGKNISVNWEVYSMEEVPVPAGATVGGIVRSHRPEEPVRVTLLQDGRAVYETTAGGVAARGAGAAAGREDSSGTEKTTAVRSDNAFLLEGVMPGVYTLRLEKEMHAAVEVRNLKIEDSALDLSLHPDSRVRNLCLPYGDVDGDGTIGFLDRQLLLRSGFYGKRITDLPPEEREEAGRLDLDGDGWIKGRDLQILMAAENFGKSRVCIDLGD